jgi:hypothetical protein
MTSYDDRIQSKPPFVAPPTDECEFYEDAHEESHEPTAKAAKLLAAEAINRLLEFCTREVQIKPGCERQIARRFLACVWQMRPELLAARPDFRKLAHRCGFSDEQIAKGKADYLIGNPDHIQVEAPSLRQLSRQLGVSPATMAIGSGDFVREFGIQNGGGAHAHNRRPAPSVASKPQPIPEDEITAN